MPNEVRTMVDPQQIPHLNIVPADLIPCGEPDDPTARLSCTVWMMGALFRIDAIGVDTNHKNHQTGVNVQCEEMLTDLDALTAGDGQFITNRIRGRSYVLFMAPWRE